VKEWGSSLGTNVHSWFTVFLRGENVITIRHVQLWTGVRRVWFTVHPTLEDLHMGNHGVAHLITLFSMVRCIVN